MLRRSPAMLFEPFSQVDSANFPVLASRKEFEMDHLSWAVDPFPPCNWSSQLGSAFSQSDDHRYGIIGGEADFDDEVLLKPGSELQGITSEASSDLHSLEQIMESINATLDPDLFQHQVSDSPLAAFGIGDTLSQLCSLPPIFDGEDGVSAIFSGSGDISSGESDNHDSGHRKSLEAASQDSSHSPTRKRKSGECGEGGFRFVFENPSELKKPKSERCAGGSSSIDFRGEQSGYEPDTEAIAQVKEMIYRAAALRPVSLGVTAAEPVEKPKRKNVRISSDPQTVAARHRRERISERLRVLQRLVPGGSKMDTASMLDEAANYLKFLKSQVTALEFAQGNSLCFTSTTPFNQPLPMHTTLFPLPKP